MRISHRAFCVLFPLALFAVCNGINIGRLSLWFRDGPGIDYSALCAYLLAGLALTVGVFTLLAHRLTIKPAAIVLTTASGAATYFIAKYGVAIDSSMIRNAFHTDATEVKQLLSWQMVPYLVALILVPAILISRIRISFRMGARHWVESAQVFAIAMVIALASLYVESQAIFRAGNTSNKYIVYSLVPINVISGSVNAASKSLQPYFSRRQRDIQFTAKVAMPGDLVVVLAVGESSRRSSFGVYGYERRNTTPQLSRIDGLHFLDAVATRASTLYALPKILEKDDIKLTTVTSRAGISTACYVNYTLYDNCDAVGEIAVRDCARPKCYDEDVIPLLEENLRGYSSGYRFVLLHLGGGSHGPLYADRHPPEFARFKPACDDADVANQCSLEELHNAYDNTILYVDHVLGLTIRALDESKVPYVFIYLSDHGESLLEDGRMFHGVPPGMALPAEQAQIPLIVKSSIPISLVPRAEYQQPQVFDTVLDLLSVETDRFDRAGSFIKKGVLPEP